MDHRAIREHVTRIEESETINDVKYERRLLRHLVESSLAGREDRLKVKFIAVDIFDRNHVKTRQTLARLRPKLLLYYDSEGKRVPIRIEVPRRTCIPQFSWASKASEPPELVTIDHSKPTPQVERPVSPLLIQTTTLESPE